MNKPSVAFRKLQSRIARLNRNLTAQDLYWLWRSSLLSNCQSNRQTQAGFVLPTTMLLLLMLSLVLGILIFRTGSRNTEIIGNRQQRQLYNAATPAMHRAQSKLEFLFGREPLPPLPSDRDLQITLQSARYDLADETRLDLDGNASTVDPAWQFDVDVDGDSTTGTDGREVTIAYSILSLANAPNGNQNVSLENSDALKARFQVVRNGPINLQGGAANPNCTNLALAPQAGWQPINSATLRKAMQVNAFAKNNETGATATLEMQQDRQANFGNKWGAWFRYDLELHPGPTFRWNGAMHSEANMFLSRWSNPLTLYLVSSPSSCIYTRDASEITVTNGSPRSTFRGHLMAGKTANDTNSSSGQTLAVHRFAENLGGGNPSSVIYGASNDSVTGNSVNPTSVAIEPVLLLTEDRNRSRSTTDPDNTGSSRDNGWDQRELATTRRMYNDTQPAPYLDDTFRADNRWGPKPQYTTTLVMNEDTNNNGSLEAGEDANGSASLDVNRTGDRITTAYDGATELTAEIAPVGNETQYGFDGYWERRSMAHGVRLVVGQRLELGNAFGWIREEDTDGDNVVDDDEDLDGNRLWDVDPLNPPPAEAAAGSSLAARSHEQRQWRTLRDNLAAVQTTAVYHYLSNGGDYPAACLASTTHPGTDGTRNNSRTFDLLPEDNSRLDVNFLTGQGTNGIEFSAPFSGAANPENTFAGHIDNSNSFLRRSLTNLARFAGDPAGGFPAEQDTVTASTENAAFRYANFSAAQATGVVHPYPQLTMWGDFSNLRRVLTYLEDDTLDGGDIDTYDELSPADRTTLQTATCTLGALAYSLENQEIAYTNAINSSGPSLQAIGVQLFKLMDGRVNSGNREIGANTGNTCTSFNGSGGCPSQNPYTVGDTSDPEDYRNYYAQFTPDEWVQALRSAGRNNHADKLERIFEAFELRNQIRRDRTLGFAKGVGIPGSSTNYDWQNLTYDLDDGPGLGNAISGIAEALVIYENIGCDPSEFGLSEKAEVGLSIALCPSVPEPKYPSLYYLFPLAEHAPDGRLSTAAQSNGIQVDQPASEPYVNASDHPYIFDRANARGINCRPTGGVCQDNTFRPIGDTNNNGVESSTEPIGFVQLRNQLGMAPRMTSGSWVTPVATSATDRVNTITVNGSNLYPAFMDKAFFNGREMMAVRTLDVDFDLLRRTTIAGQNDLFGGTPVADTDYWLPLPDVTGNADPTRTGAIFYAFREDNVREDAIARPRRVTDSYPNWLANWLTYVNNASAGSVSNYLMNAVGQISQANWNSAVDSVNDLATDPPINPRTGISPKSVDFYADPDRRPNGFRLRNGADLRRMNGGNPVIGTVTEPERRGVAFITDNPVYIQSDDNAFNLHTQEEFQEALTTNWSNFYQRSTLNPDFASRNDQWRSMEIISDAITILSDNFVEGSIERAIINNAPGSFNGLNRNSTTNMFWVREDGEASFVLANEQPIKISHRGFPIYCRKETNSWFNSDPASSLPERCDRPFRQFEYGRETVLSALGGAARSNYSFEGFNRTRRSGNSPANSTVNAIMVSGVIPSRNAQSSGGLHNFPRFIENWNNLFISGSFIQLNFSNSATGQTDQDSWEPGDAPTGSQRIGYYSPPNRLWGYDVALQFAPAGSVSERFVSVSNTRSEFYRELPVDDPYMLMLRCSEPAGGGTQVDPNLNGC